MLQLCIILMLLCWFYRNKIKNFYLEQKKKNFLYILDNQLKLDKKIFSTT